MHPRRRGCAALLGAAMVLGLARGAEAAPTTAAEDLDCPTAPERGDARMNKSELIEHIAKSSGFTTEPGFLAALNAYSNQIVAEALHRAGSNKRGTVRPYDL